MCEGYWDRRLQRWVSLEDLEEREAQELLTVDVSLPPPTAEPKRSPALLMR